MKFIKPLIYFSILAFFATSCKKEETLGPVNNISGLGGDVWTAGAIDKWIVDSLTTNYNIAVKYKWDQSEVDLDKTLVPPMEEEIIPLMSSIKKAWVNTYVAEAGVLFFKKISPKFFNLVGSPAYERGAIKLGTAEGGRKVVLYNVNSFRIKGMTGYTNDDTSQVIEVFHTIQHEFAHILDQNIRVPISFSAPSASSYTSDWLNVTEAEALNEGFITQYSISGRDEDWAEMVSTMLVHGKPWFNNLVNNINYTGTTPNGTTAEKAKARLRQKEASLVSYFKQAWNIDFYSLQSRTKASINSLLY